MNRNDELFGRSFEFKPERPNATGRVDGANGKRHAEPEAVLPADQAQIYDVKAGRWMGQEPAGLESGAAKRLDAAGLPREQPGQEGRTVPLPTRDGAKRGEFVVCTYDTEGHLLSCVVEAPIDDLWEGCAYYEWATRDDGAMFVVEYTRVSPP